MRTAWVATCLTPDVTEPGDERTGASPEAVLEYLSGHRQRVDAGGQKTRRGGGRGRGGKTTLLGIAAAVALVAAGVLIWSVFDQGGSSSRAADTPHKGAATAQSGSGAGRTKAPKKGAASGSGSTKAPKTSAAGKAAQVPTDEPWHHGLQAWRSPTDQGPADIYHGSLLYNASCSGHTAHGCWKLTVASRAGCPHGLVVIATETLDGRDVGATEGFSGPLAAEGSVVVELDLQRPHVSGRISSLGCVPGS